jgi:protein-tyrosine sulfotransferase
MQALAKLQNLLRNYTGRRGADDVDAPYLSERNHVVIGGCGRSGTTLVRVILDSHPNICCGPESQVFLPDPLDLGRLQEKFKLPDGQLWAAYDSSRSRAQFVDLFADICAATAEKSRWAEKTPRNVLHIDYLFERFPEARFVHLLRDGRDAASSLRTHPRYRIKNGQLMPLNTWKPMNVCAQRWRDSLRAAKPHWSNPRFYTVRYEQLVSDPRQAIGGLLAFLGEPWDDAELAHSEAKSAFRDATTFPQNPEALKPIGTSAVGRWQRDMTDEDRAIFKSIAGDLLVECGYAQNGNW